MQQTLRTKMIEHAQTARMRTR